MSLNKTGYSKAKRFRLIRRYRSYNVAPMALVVAIISVCGWIMVSGSAQARSLDVPVANYPIQCDETFSCPNSLLPRVAFWIEVFSRWDTNTAIFHDKENPQRVYSTINRKNGCRRSRKGDSIDRERKRIKRSLNSLASAVEKNQALSSSQTKMRSLFVGESSSRIRSATNRIRCQSGNKDRMREALSQFQRYRPAILEALEKQNLTPELQYLPFVESAFNPNAVSHVGAAGLWQIMPQTGRSLGLKVNNVVDERYDPLHATKAAALYFRNSVNDLSETAFENGYPVIAKNLNPFVITSYNYGVRGMERAIKQVGLDYERLLVEYKSPSFQTAVKNFYASFLAARYVAKNASQFFGAIESVATPANASSTIVLRRSTSAKRLSRSLGVDKKTLKAMNPAFRKVVWNNKALMPKGVGVNLPFEATGYAASVAAMNKLPKEVEKPGFIWHRVKRGQTACGIAEKYGASCRALRSLNNLDRKGTVYIGRKIKVPTKSGGISVAGSSGGSSSATSSDSSSIQQYTVRSGDTSCKIAKRFGMKCSEFLAINGLTFKSLIRVGQSVSVSSANAWHIVTRGQTACGIAERYRVRCSALLDANRLRKSSTIQIGQRLRIPARRS